MAPFPQFGLKVDEGFLVSKVLNDSLPQKTDSLLAFKECVLIVNPLDYFLKNKISVYNLSLKNVAVYAYRNKTGKMCIRDRPIIDILSPRRRLQYWNNKCILAISSATCPYVNVVSSP